MAAPSSFLAQAATLRTATKTALRVERTATSRGLLRSHRSNRHSECDHTGADCAASSAWHRGRRAGSTCWFEAEA